MKLPLNCEIEYIRDFLDFSVANELFKELTSLAENIDYTPQTKDGKIYEVNFGKIMFIDQHLLDENRFPEAHWRPTKPWTDKLKAVKNLIESSAGLRFYFSRQNQDR